MEKLATLAASKAIATRGRRGWRILLRARPELILSPTLFVLVVGAWELIVRVFKIAPYILPPPSAIAVALYRGLSASPLSREGYWLHAGVTLAETLLGFFIGSSVGLLLGMAISQFRLLECTLRPYIIAFQSLPKVAVAPVIVLWFGFGMTSKVLIVCLLTFFPLLVTSMAGFKAVDPERIDLLRSLSATRWKIFWKVKFPSALPYVFAGLDMATVFSVVGAIVGEFVGAQRGLGVQILQMNFAMDIAGTFSVFALLSAMGVGMYLLLQRIKRWVLFWAPSESEARVINA
jgi:NitT/TauT family transport system permease protein